MWMAALALMGATLTHGGLAHGGQADGAAPLAPGTATIEVLAEGDAAPAPARTPAERVARQQELAVRQAFADGIEKALLNSQFTILPPNARGRYIARFTLDRAEKGAVAARGGGAQSSTAGAGVSVSLGSGKTQLRGLVITTLGVELVSRATGEVVWRGQALTAQAGGSRADTPAALAEKLAPAALRSFPQSLAEPVSVP